MIESEILLGAYKFLSADKTRWCQTMWGQDLAGDEMSFDSLSLAPENVTSCCLDGALVISAVKNFNASAINKESQRLIMNNVRHYILEAIPKSPGLKYEGNSTDIWVWNDTPNRDYSEVLLVLQRAADLALAEA